MCFILTGRALNQTLKVSGERFAIVMKKLGQIFGKKEPVHIISDVIPAGLLIIRVEDGSVIFSNRYFEELLGEDGSEVFGRSWEKFFIDPQDRQDLMVAFSAEEEVRNRELRLKGNDGQVIWGLISISPIEINNEDMLLFAFSDVTPLKKAYEEIEHLANHDTLTGLPSLRLLNDRIDHAITKAQREQREVAVLFIDLDGFKSVNDELGHDIGDLVLKTSARRLKTCVRKSDTTARIGGDEFIIVLETHEAERTRSIAKRIVREISKPVKTETGTAHIGASIGVAVYPRNGDNTADLLKAADSAMYEIKKGSKGGVAYA